MHDKLVNCGCCSCDVSFYWFARTKNSTPPDEFGWDSFLCLVWFVSRVIDVIVCYAHAHSMPMYTREGCSRALFDTAYSMQIPLPAIRGSLSVLWKHLLFRMWRRPIFFCTLILLWIWTERIALYVVLRSIQSEGNSFGNREYSAHICDTIYSFWRALRKSWLVELAKSQYSSNINGAGIEQKKSMQKLTSCSGNLFVFNNKRLLCTSDTGSLSVYVPIPCGKLSTFKSTDLTSVEDSAFFLCTKFNGNNVVAGFSIQHSRFRRVFYSH